MKKTISHVLNTSVFDSSMGKAIKTEVKTLNETENWKTVLGATMHDKNTYSLKRAIRCFMGYIMF